ncbi:AAA family ATPase [Castellaniella caeni]
MLIHSIQLNNFLSFGPSAKALQLGPLNVLIGPNGSGKSNLMESITLLQSAPDKLMDPIRDGGGVRDWLWKGGSTTPEASLDFVLSNPLGKQNLRYTLAFTEVGQRFEIVDERVENEAPQDEQYAEPYFYYHFNRGRPVLNVGSEKRALRQEDVDLEKSILSQRKDPDQYPEITWLGQTLGKIRLYREWSFGRYTAPRAPQKTDLPNVHLEPDASNLGLVLNRLSNQPAVKQRLLTALQALYDGITDYHVQFEGGTVQVFFHEGPSRFRPHGYPMAPCAICACWSCYAIPIPHPWFASRNPSWACTQTFCPPWRNS